MFTLFRILFSIRLLSQTLLFTGFLTLLYNFLSFNYEIKLFHFNKEISLFLFIIFLCLGITFLFYLPSFILNLLKSANSNFESPLRIVGNLIYTGVISYILSLCYHVFSNIPDVYGYILKVKNFIIQRSWSIQEMNEFVTNIRHEFSTVSDIQWEKLVQSNTNPYDFLNHLQTYITSSKSAIEQQIFSIQTLQKNRISWGEHVSTFLWDSRYTIFLLAGACITVYFLKCYFSGDIEGSRLITKAGVVKQNVIDFSNYLITSTDLKLMEIFIEYQQLGLDWYENIIKLLAVQVKTKDQIDLLKKLLPIGQDIAKKISGTVVPRLKNEVHLADAVNLLEKINNAIQKGSQCL